jgi:7-cyano-7-deazaguanine synthase
MINDKFTGSVLLASGGLDSTTLAYWLRARQIEFTPLFINYGQHFAKTEYETLIKVLPEKIVPNIKTINVSEIYLGSKSLLISEPDLWNDEVTYEDMYIPYRNLLILTIAAAFAQSNGYTTIYAAFINSNHAQEIDCSAEFFSQLESILSAYGSVSVEMPFRNLSKLEVAKLGMSLGAPIGRTFSCQASSEIPCGACPNCVDRLEALAKLSEQII